MQVPNPFRGPRPHEDSSSFFGREVEIADLLALLIVEPVTTLFGPSAIGKSSLLKAGVLPQLHSSPSRPFLAPIYTRVVDRENWHEVLLQDVRSQIAAEFGREVEPVSTLRQLLHNAALGDSKSFLILIDQIEHAFAHPDAAAFHDLCSSFTDAVTSTHFLLSIRQEEFYRLEDFEERYPDIFRSSYRLRPLKEEAARRALTEPARENPLPAFMQDRILAAALCDGPSYLPQILSIVAAGAFQYRLDYPDETDESTGFSTGRILDQFVRQALGSLLQPHRPTTAEAVLRLIVPDEFRHGSVPIDVCRRRVCQDLGCDDAEVDAALEDLQSRSLIFVHDRTCEPPHGSLVETIAGLLREYEQPRHNLPQPSATGIELSFHDLRHIQQTSINRTPEEALLVLFLAFGSAILPLAEDDFDRQATALTLRTLLTNHLRRSGREAQVPPSLNGMLAMARSLLTASTSPPPPPERWQDLLTTSPEI